MALVPLGPGNAAMSTSCTATVSGVGYDAVLTATCDFDAVEANAYLVTAAIGGGYYTGRSDEDAMLVVFDPCRDKVGGAGKFFWPGTADPDAGYPGDRTDFAIKAKFKKDGTLKGKVDLESRLADGGKIRLKSKELVALVQGRAADGLGTFRWAVVGGLGELEEPGVPGKIPGHQFLVYLEDRAKKGTGHDRFWIEVWDPNGGYVPELSLPRPPTASAVVITSGNVKIEE